MLYCILSESRPEDHPTLGGFSIDMRAQQAENHKALCNGDKGPNPYARTIPSRIPPTKDASQ